MACYLPRKRSHAPPSQGGTSSPTLMESIRVWAFREWLNSHKKRVTCAYRSNPSKGQHREKLGYVSRRSRAAIPEPRRESSESA